MTARPSCPATLTTASALLILVLSAARWSMLFQAASGAYFAVDAAKSPLTRSDIDFSNLRRSYSVGLTVHAGGLPVVYLAFRLGGNEGTHTTLSVSNILLGASPRPSLFLVAPPICCLHGFRVCFVDRVAFWENRTTLRFKGEFAFKATGDDLFARPSLLWR